MSSASVRGIQFPAVPQFVPQFAVFPNAASAPLPMYGTLPVATTLIDQHSLKDHIQKLYKKYLNNLQELAERGHEEDGTPKAKERRHLLEQEIREYCCQIPHEQKYFLGSSFELIVRETVEQRSTSRQLEPVRTADAFKSLERYAVNILLQPWRPEFQRIKLYGGYFRHKVSRYVSDAVGILELMGYVADEQNPQCMRLKPMNRLRRSSPVLPLIDKEDVVLVALDCLIAGIEIQIMLLLLSNVRECKYTFADIYKARSQYAGLNMAETMLRLKHQYQEKQRRQMLKQSEWISPQEQIYRHRQQQQGNFAPSFISRDGRRPRRDVVDDEEVNKIVEMSQSYLDEHDHHCGYGHPAPKSIRSSRGLANSRFLSSGRSPSVEYHHHPMDHSDRTPHEPGPSLLDSDLSPAASAAENFGVVLKPTGSAAGRDSTGISTDDALRSRVKAVEELMRNFSLDSDSPLRRAANAANSDDAIRFVSSLVDSGNNSRIKLASTTSLPNSRPGSSTETSRILPQSEPVTRIIPIVREGDDSTSQHRHPATTSNLAGNITTSVSSSTMPVSSSSVMSSSPEASSTSSNNRPFVSSGKNPPDDIASSTPAAASSSVTGLQKKWSCAACTFLNAANSDVCEMCSKSRNLPPETPLTSGGKECPRCTLINDRESVQCTACELTLDDSPTYI